MAAVYYRHYEMRDKIEQSRVCSWFWNVLPMTTAADCYIAVMDDFGYLQAVNIANTSSSTSNGSH